MKCETTVKQFLIVKTNHATLPSYSKWIRDNTDICGKTVYPHDQTTTDGVVLNSGSIQRAHGLGSKFWQPCRPVDPS
jgi:hypothetical protein